MKTVTTIKDVAQKAGVSAATVSRVVNGHDKIKPATAERVRAAIKALGFRPNAMGRSLKTARSHTFGILLPSLSNPIFAEVMEGIQTAACTAGYSVLITCSNYREAEEQQAIEIMLANRVDGLILTVADSDNSARLDWLDQYNIPYVLLFNQPAHSMRSAVTVDNAAAGRVVAEEFIELGHERLGMIAGRFDASDRSRARYSGFKAGVEAAGLLSPTLVEVDFVRGRTQRAVHNLLSQADAPTGLFCSTDLLAFSVIQALRELEIEVPKDISVIGFDGISFGLLSHPSLATMVQPSHKMGQAAVQNLLGKLTASAAPRVQILPTEFRPGASAGPVPLLGSPSRPTLNSQTHEGRINHEI